ncbi:MAG: GSU2403 family nucleotidyltransferase fold protein [bacterium]|nr:GSU2403 family nucleotidyltransferase fold protein [bacterium]
MERIPLETRTLYAELMEQLIAFEAHRSIGKLPGTFTTKEVKGETYHYFQYSEPGGVKKQTYLGKDSPALRKVVKNFHEERESNRLDREGIQRLCALLRAGGALVTDTASARVIRSLGEAGVFHLGGVLVGTNAFIVLGNLLGARWDKAALRTLDIDIAGGARMEVAVPQSRADIPEALENLQMGFLPVPPFNSREPCTSFKVRGKPLRVDLLTPKRKGSRGGPARLPRFNASAIQLPYMDYLIENPVKAAAINGGGILVNVPDPARFAYHKLLTAGERSVTEHTKVEKDILQAAQVFDLLFEERPEDVKMAREAILGRGKTWLKKVGDGVKRLGKLHPERDWSEAWI